MAKNTEVFINCYNYGRVIAAAIKNVNDKNVGVGDNPSNFEKLTIKNCYSLSDLAKINEALAASCAGVFVYDESSSSFKIATAKYVN